MLHEGWGHVWVTNNNCLLVRGLVAAHLFFCPFLTVLGAKPLIAEFCGILSSWGQKPLRHYQLYNSGECFWSSGCFHKKHGFTEREMASKHQETQCILNTFSSFTLAIEIDEAYKPEQGSSHFGTHQKSPGHSVRILGLTLRVSTLVGMRVGLRICSSNKSPDCGDSPLSEQLNEWVRPFLFAFWWQHWVWKHRDDSPHISSMEFWAQMCLLGGRGQDSSRARNGDQNRDNGHMEVKEENNDISTWIFHC